jgi:energy-coupling factor transporter ATP-binding protein EcfA2
MTFVGSEAGPIRRFLAKIWQRRKKINVFDVFTPTTQAKANFVRRPRVENRLHSALKTPGTQIVVYGESGSGKSTLLLNELARINRSYVTTRCTTNDSFGSILLEAFDQLDKWVATQRAEKKQSETLNDLSLQIGELKAGASGHDTRSSEILYSPLVSPQLTPQKLGQLLGVAGKAWVIEDFHKIPAAEKPALAQTLKVFSDLAADYPLVRIIVIGATDSAKEVVEHDREMNTRVAEIYVPPLDEDELSEILLNGGRLMNVSFDKVRGEVVRHSVGVASVAHQLALNCLLNMGIEEPSERRKRVSDSDLSAAAEQYVLQSSATLKDRFDKGVVRVRVRHFDNGRLIVRALAELPIEGALHSELLGEIRKIEPDYPSGNLTVNVKALMTEEKGSLVRKSADGRFRFSEPLLQTYARLAFVPVGPKPVNSIDDFDDIYLESLSRLLATSLHSRRELGASTFEFDKSSSVIETIRLS